VPVIMVTAFGDVEAAVAAIKQGAYDFITKPADEAELLNVMRKALAESAGNRELLSDYFDEAPAALSGFIGKTPAIAEIVRTVNRIAPTDATVLITGETGVGKELIAKGIHLAGPRREHPFVKVNCAAIPETLVESELFGYEKGAFTGAVINKPGRFEIAHRGTLFLDEIGDVPLHLQVKLLSVLQDRSFERVGGVRTIKADTRVIAATNRDLAADVKSGRFRSDLFYRLNVVPIHVPPLRERREDILLQAEYLLGKFRKKHRKGALSLAPETESALLAHDWPGNTREMENVLERMVLLTEGTVLRPERLPPELRGAGTGPAPATMKGKVGEVQRVAEKRLIVEALEKAGGNRTRAAQALGISRRTLQNKLKKAGGDVPD
jgi:DNA-binding NtrC family response regulator